LFQRRQAAQAGLDNLVRQVLSRQLCIPACRQEVGPGIGIIGVWSIRRVASLMGRRRVIHAKPLDPAICLQGSGIPCKPILDKEEVRAFGSVFMGSKNPEARVVCKVRVNIEFDSVFRIIDLRDGSIRNARVHDRSSASVNARLIVASQGYLSAAKTYHRRQQESQNNHALNDEIYRVEVSSRSKDLRSPLSWAPQCRFRRFPCWLGSSMKRE